MTTPPTFQEVFQELVAGTPSGATVGRVIGAILEGAWTPAQIGGFLSALRLRGETAEALGAAARAMRAAMVPAPHSRTRVLDTCGTGGDGLGTHNLSTGAALLVAGAGVAVAKHGNRAVSSRTGSADVLEALGIPLDLSPAAAGAVLDEAGITFLMAPVHHPAMRHAAPARRELGIRTIFNVLGPLANPAGATHQLVGAPDERLRPLLAASLAELGTVRAWVVRGEDGLDEVSPTGPTRVTEVAGGARRELVVTPEDFGVERLTLDHLRGGDAAGNAAAIEALLEGRGGPATDGFVLNAAAALVVAEALPPREATARIRAAIESGAARRVLAGWRAAATARRAPPAGG